MAFPLMKPSTGTPLSTYKIDDYVLMVIHGAEALGPIQYIYMLLATRTGAKLPTLIVTCEVNELQRQLADKMTNATRETPDAFFCYFDEDGVHHNIEAFDQIPDADTFTRKALQLACERLGVSGIPRPIKPQSLASSTGRFRTTSLVAGLAAISLASIASYAYLQVPKTYEDCILANVKSSMSTPAAGLLTRTCRQKFPETTDSVATRGLTDSELKKITGRGGASSFQSYFSGNIYNGNQGVVVRQLTIQVTSTIGGIETANSYIQKVNIPPMTAKDIFFSFIPGDSGAAYQWTILSAGGTDQ